MGSVRLSTRSRFVEQIAHIPHVMSDLSGIVACNEIVHVRTQIPMLFTVLAGPTLWKYTAVHTPAALHKAELAAGMAVEAITQAMHL